jgi:PAS domain S-box-containing protein
MSNKLGNVISKGYGSLSKSEQLKLIGLHIVAATMVILGLIALILDLTKNTNDSSIPGDISIILIFGAMLYGLKYHPISWAVNFIFLSPLIAYFYFISEPFSILPLEESIHLTLWCLIGGFLFLLLFDHQLKKISLFGVLAITTMLTHIVLANQTNQLGDLLWSSELTILNPLLAVVIGLVFSALIAVYFQFSIEELKVKAEETEQRINQTAKSLQQGLLVLDVIYDEYQTPVSLRINKTNPAFDSMFKIAPRDTKGKEADLVFPIIFRDSFPWYDHYFTSKKTKVELYVEHLDKWLEVYTMRPSPDQVISLFYDISGKQKTILELEDSRQRFKVLLEAIPDIFFIIDSDGVYVDFVFKESELLKIKPDDIIGNSIFEVGFSERMANKIMQCIQDCIEFDTIEVIEYALEVESGTAMFEMRIARLNDNSVISIARDITKRKMIEMQLEAAKNKAEESDRLKSAFLANISHEIRTPMNAIIGFSRMLSSPDFDLEEKNKFVDIIVSNGKALLELINDMISLSKIESDMIVVKKGNCRLNDLMVNLQKDFSYDVDENKNVKLKLTTANTNPKFTVITDQVLLKEVLEKLIDNAIKFTERGEVEFGYRIENKKIFIFVRDTGIGIALEDQARIFERFHQLDNRTTRDYGGTGLGLSIAKHYVSMLGGRLHVESELGKGSVFSFTIPYEAEESPLKVVR